MITSMLHLLPTSVSYMVGRNPGQQAGSAVTRTGAAPSGSQGTQQGVTGNAQTASQQQAAAPAQPGLIRDTDIYILDPNDPDNSRMSGVQLREGMHQIRNFNNVQSSLHRSQNDIQNLQAQLAQVNQEIARRDEEARMTNLLRTMGYGPNQVGVQTQNPQSFQAPIAPQQQGQGLPQEAEEEDWLGFIGGQQTPQTAHQPAQQTVNTSANLDPQGMVRLFNTLLEQNTQKLLGQLQTFIPNMVEQSISRKTSEQDRRNSVQSRYSAAKQNLVDKFRGNGFSPEGARSIADKLFLSIASTEQARDLMNTQFETPQDQQLANETADQRLAQGIEFFQSAMNDAITQGVEARQKQFQEEAANMLETGTFVPQILGDLTEPARDVYDPIKIEQIKQQNAEKAAEIAEVTANLQRTAGGGAGIFTR